jgi:hypothetical protein
MVGIRNRFDLMMNYLIKTNWNVVGVLISKEMRIRYEHTNRVNIIMEDFIAISSSVQEKIAF